MKRTGEKVRTSPGKEEEGEWKGTRKEEGERARRAGQRLDREGSIAKG